MERLLAALVNQMLYLGCSGEHRAPKGEKWFKMIDGLYYCRIEVAGKSMVLDPDTLQEWVIFGSQKEACEWYKVMFEALNSGEMNDMIRKHLAKIPPRKKRTNGGGTR